MNWIGQRIISCRSIVTCHLVANVLKYYTLLWPFSQVPLLIRVNMCWKCSCNEDMWSVGTIFLCLQVSTVMSSAWTTNTALCQPEIGELGCAHNLSVSRVTIFYTCMHTMWLHLWMTAFWGWNNAGNWETAVGVWKSRQLFWYSSSTSLRVLCEVLWLHN